MGLWLGIACDAIKFWSFGVPPNRPSDARALDDVPRSAIGQEGVATRIGRRCCIGVKSASAMLKAVVILRT